MEWFWIVVAAGGSGFAARWWRTRRKVQRASSQELEAVRRLTVEDIDDLGVRLQQVEADVGVRSSEEDLQRTYRRAVDAYASARSAVSRVLTAEEISRVTDAVARGRNALASTQARLAGHVVPEDRVMCFFDPQHGPSATDVMWSRPGHGERCVPACSRDAQLLADGRQPEIRVVQVGARTTPYWTAGSAFRPYTQGYFAAVPALAWAFAAEVSDAAARPAAPGTIGSGIVGSSGHFDGGGFDGTGAPS